MTRVVLVPGALALLPSYGGLEDPVADLRAACLDAVRWLGADPRVVAGAQGATVATYLATEVSRLPSRLASSHLRTSASLAPQPSSDGVLFVANGSAKRTEKAPGHLDDRAMAFDDALRAALLAGDLGDLDEELARELWADVDSLVRLGQEIDVDPASVQVDYDDDPYGVQYWVMRMEGRWR
ncbi:hypothetical protein NSZ01_39010 [Nocardioides szechwanensis]|uniref:Uncharacterized protein n=1 Tax=Nocardioides szechwanensis TaxID=1005944 RepID=A0A1H0BL48_9ACTN|nr:hypothetical protein [Nocardioides szechwanensis]GEP36133.1 hypothetical protein NSZ01_39010 [Nocardioides szechwanensis]SDN46380.1 hypothetical protein SAMN05192576_2168 [Nocardioides szechwanensis]